MGQEREKKFPVGTQRTWSTGQFIKTHDNNIFEDIHPAWMPLPVIPQSFLEKFKDCDSIAKKIFGYKEPIEGELWLDKEFENFVTSTDKTFTGTQFKQYSPYVKGTYGYNFYYELSKRYLDDKIKLNSAISDALVKANEEKIHRLRASGTRVEDGIILSKEEIKDIKETVRLNFKYDETQKLVLQDVVEIHNTLKEINGYLEKGEKFTGEEKELYDRALVLHKELTSGKYRNIIQVKADVREMIAKMNETFKANWGIRESYRKKIQNALESYISKYHQEIEDDELENFKKQLGIDLYSPTTEFYSALRKSPLFNDIDVLDKKYIGTFIQSPSNYDSKYDDFTLFSVKKIEGEEDGSGKEYYITYGSAIDEEDINTAYISKERLQDLIRAKQTGLSSLDVPMKLRFKKMFDKNLSGEWNEKDLTLLETFEKLSNYLPQGHILTNSQLSKIQKQDSFSGDNSYAHYSPSERNIFFSSKALSHTDIGVSDLHSGNEIASVLTHEVGHSVSYKLKRRASLDYRKFVVECGWSWQQFQHVDAKRGIDKTNNFVATGNAPDIKRYGTKSDVPLITEYAGKSPEEAFAEYYSFYTQYKHEIDTFLSGNPSKLEKHQGYNRIDSDKKYGDFLKEKRITSDSKLAGELQSIRAEIKNVLLENKRDSSHIKTDLVDPYYNNLETMREEKVNTSLIITEKTPSSYYSTNYKNPNPVFTIFNPVSGKHDILDSDEVKDKEIHYANKYLRRQSPTYSISSDAFHLLTQKGFSVSQIKDYVLSEVSETVIPKVKIVNQLPSTFKGLKYRSQIIPSSKLQKMSGIFRHMKNIWESDELKKALEELGLTDYKQEIEQMDTLEKAQFGDLISMFSNTIETLKNILGGAKKKGKQKYGDCIIRNTNGDILLLHRSYNDTFEPGKWCLPGGKVEEGESFLEGAERELLEETGLDFKGKLTHISEIEKDDCIINYFEGILEGEFASILDNEEHYRLQFVPIDELCNYDLLLNLGDVLKELPLSIIPTNVKKDLQLEILDISDLIKKKEEVIKSFNEDKITTEEYQQELSKIKVKAFEFIKKGFDEGLVKVEDYQRAYNETKTLLNK